MSRTLLIIPATHGAGLTTACMGLVRAFEQSGVSVGYLKPIEQRASTMNGDVDHSIDLIRNIARLDPPAPLAAEHVEELLAHRSVDDVMEEIVAMAMPITSAHDVVIVHGLVPGPGLVYSSQVNLALAKALDAEVVMVSTAVAGSEQYSAARIADLFTMAGAPYHAGETVRIAGCIVNRVPDAKRETLDAIRNALHDHGYRLIGASVHRPELAWLRVKDIAQGIGARFLSEGDANRRVSEVVVCAQSAAHILAHFKENRLLVMPGDRDDVIMAACLSALNGTPLAGLLLTAGVEPTPAVWEVTAAARASHLPIMIVDELTYPTATRVYNLSPEVPIDDTIRAEGLTETVAEGIDPEWIQSIANPVRKGDRRISPAAFRYHLTTAARNANKRIVLPEGAEPRTLEAATICHERGIARCVLLAKADDVAETARRHSLLLPDSLDIVDPEAIAGNYVDRLVSLRAHKGMTPGMAANQLVDPITVGTMMLEAGEVDGLVSGAVHTTAHTIRPALQLIKTAPEAKIVSSVFFMLLPDDVAVYGDCAVNPDPNAEELADIALQSAASARSFGLDPRVAMISFSTGESGSGSDVEKVALATKLVQERAPELAVDGPLQYDAAAVASVGQSKRPGSTVAGRANVFIFPDLNTGNTTYKAVQRSADVISIGPMLQGLAKPVNDLSRGALVEDIVYTISLTAIQAAQRPAS